MKSITVLQTDSGNKLLLVDQFLFEKNKMEIIHYYITSRDLFENVHERVKNFLKHQILCDSKLLTFGGFHILRKHIF